MVEPESGSGPGSHSSKAPWQTTVKTGPDTHRAPKGETVMPDDTWPAELFALADLVTPMALRVAATLRLADHVAEGATTLPELAGRSGSNAAVLGRVIRHLAAVGVFTQDEGGAVGLGRLGRGLLSGDQAGARDWLDINGAVGRADLALFGLLDTVTNGRAAYPAVYGRGFWANLDGDPALAASFNLLMRSQLRVGITELATSFDWASAASMVDVGGGDGTLLSAILRAHPHLRGTLVEVPVTAAAAKAGLTAGELAGRCEVAAGSFFDPLPAGGDVYLLSEVLHDWPDPEATAILRRCRTRRRPAVPSWSSKGSASPAPRPGIPAWTSACWFTCPGGSARWPSSRSWLRRPA